MAEHHELSHLAAEQLDELAQDVTDAAAFASIGCPVGRDDVSGMKVIRPIYFSDIKRALKKQGLPVSTSRRYSDSNGVMREALVFQLARLVASRVRVKHPKGHTVPLTIPADPYRLFKTSEDVAYK